MALATGKTGEEVRFLDFPYCGGRIFILKKGVIMAVEKELIAIRKEKKISQEEISNAIGLSREQYRRKELGQYDWKATEMFAIRNYLEPFIGQRSLNEIFYDKTTQNVYKAS